MTKRFAMVVATTAVIACSRDTSPVGPGPNDPVCQRWELTLVNGEWVPGALFGSIRGGSIEMLCTGWFRLTKDLAQGPDHVVVGRYEEDGDFIHCHPSRNGGHFHPSRNGGPLVGTVSGTDLHVHPLRGDGWESYRRVE